MESLWIRSSMIVAQSHLEPNLKKFSPIGPVSNPIVSDCLKGSRDLRKRRGTSVSRTRSELEMRRSSDTKRTGAMGCLRS